MPLILTIWRSKSILFRRILFCITLWSKKQKIPAPIACKSNFFHNRNLIGSLFLGSVFQFKRTFTWSLSIFLVKFPGNLNFFYFTQKWFHVVEYEMFRQNKNRRFWKRSVLKYYSFLSFVVHLRDLFFSERLHLIFCLCQGTRVHGTERVLSDWGPQLTANERLMDKCQPPKIHRHSSSRIWVGSIWSGYGLIDRWSVMEFVDPCFTHLEWFSYPIKIF